jgi:hypothetical protein
MMALRAVVVAGVSALLTEIRVADFTAAEGTTMGEVLIFVMGFFEPNGTKLSLFFCNSFS